MKEKLYKYLFEYSHEYKNVLNELYLQYKNIGKFLDQYLGDLLNQITEEKETITKNYEETKERYKEIEEKMLSDIKSIKELMPEISLIFSQYF